MTEEEMETARLELAQPEIDRLNNLEVELEKLSFSATPLTNAQLITTLSERRKVIELRCQLSGALPRPVLQEGYDG